MKNLSSYFTLNLLSALGYIFLIFLIVVVFHLYPEAKVYDHTSGEDLPYGQMEIMILCSATVLIYTLIEFLLIFFIFPAEILFYKLKKTKPQIIKIPHKFKKFHLISLILGILISILPLLGGAYLLFNSV